MKQFLVIVVCLFFIYCANRTEIDDSTVVEDEGFSLVIEKGDKAKEDVKPEFVIKVYLENHLAHL